MSSPLDRVIQELSKLPGIGEKTATRLAFYLLKAPKSYVESLSQSIIELIQRIQFCNNCQNFTEKNPCRICSDEKRNSKVLLVIEGPQEMRAIEQAGGYRGHYHILHGALSPLDRIGPEDLKIKELLNRLYEKTIEEVILATNPNVEGEATSLYLAKLIKPLHLKVTRIATGIPVGSDLEYIDSMTLQKAIEGRREI